MPNPYEGLTPEVQERAMQIARDMPDMFPAAYAVYLAQEEGKLLEAMRDA